MKDINDGISENVFIRKKIQLPVFHTHRETKNNPELGIKPRQGLIGQCILRSIQNICVSPSKIGKDWTP